MRPLPPLPDWLKLEHQVAHILTQQEIHGWHFDELAARKLESTLRDELRETTDLLRDRYAFVAGPEFTPKRNNRTKGYVANATFTKLKELNELREGSYRRDRIKRYWVGDNPVVSEMSRYYQEIGDDLGRRERMAEAMYDV
jgi:hypothetical protein